MKTYSTMILLLFAHALSAQTWSWQNPIPHANSSNDIRFIDANNGFYVAYASYIAKTTNGGATWTQVQTTFNADLFGLQFLDATNGFICGSSGFVGRTTDGGATCNHSRPQAQPTFTAFLSLAPQPAT